MEPEKHGRPQARQGQGAFGLSQLGGWVEPTNSEALEQARAAERLSRRLHAEAPRLGGIATTQAADLAAHYGRVARCVMREAAR